MDSEGHEWPVPPTPLPFAFMIPKLGTLVAFSAASVLLAHLMGI